MKKKWIAGLLILTMTAALSACGSTADNTPEQKSNTESPASEPEASADFDTSSLEGILSGIKADYSNTIQSICDKLDETNTAIGNTYEDYVANQQLLSDWYTYALSEEDALFERTLEHSVIYYKLIAASVDHSDFDAMDDAIDDFYDEIYDDAMDDFYDEIYDGAMDDVYDLYYDGLIDDGYDLVPYEEWSAQSSACYKAWSDAGSAIYKSWSKAGSRLYGYSSAVYSGFFNENYDVDALIQEYEAKQESEESDTSDETGTTAEASDAGTDETEPAAENSDSSPSDGIRPEFKEAMDSYEAFFDEYAAFMIKYQNSSSQDMVGMMSDYADYLEKYAETTEKMEALGDEELSTQEALYYSEVTARISQTLLEAAQ